MTSDNVPDLNAEDALLNWIAPLRRSIDALVAAAPRARTIAPAPFAVGPEGRVIGDDAEFQDLVETLLR